MSLWVTIVFTILALHILICLSLSLIRHRASTWGKRGQLKMAKGPRLGPWGTPCGFQIRLQCWPSISSRAQLGAFICTPSASTVSQRPLVNQVEFKQNHKLTLSVLSGLARVWQHSFSLNNLTRIYTQVWTGFCFQVHGLSISSSNINTHTWMVHLTKQ